jgi:capsular polysaccharide biosynthesis protein
MQSGARRTGGAERRARLKTSNEAKKMKSKVALRIVLILGLALCAAWLCLFLWPTRYRATVRLMVAHKTNPAIFSDAWFIQTEFEVIQCDLILSNAVKRLDLLATGANKKASLDEVMRRLRRQMNSRAIKEDVLEISITDGNHDEAARTVNAIAETYCDYRAEQYRKMLKEASESEKHELEAFHDVVRIIAPATRSVAVRTLWP